MDKVSNSNGIGIKVREMVFSFIRKCVGSVLSVGPIPDHIGFIMDGNRRYARRRNLLTGEGHRLGYLAFISMLKYCYEFGIKYVTVYAFSIDNFNRSEDEVHPLLELMEEKIEHLIKEESLVNRYGVRVHFIGNLKLLSDSLRSTAERAMLATASNSNAVLSVCVAYTSTNEILHAVQESCKDKWEEIRLFNISGSGYGLNGFHKNDIILGKNLVTLVDVEKHLYLSVLPDPDILIRSSGETRLSNFLLWQSAYCLLYSPSTLWPEIGFWHLVWAVLNFQRNFDYLQKHKKQL